MASNVSTPAIWPHQRFMGLHHELMARQPLLTAFAWLMLALMVPAGLMLMLDDRTWREVAIWAKPLKFMAATALFAFTTAWFVGLLPKPLRPSRTVRVLAWTVVLTATF